MLECYYALGGINYKNGVLNGSHIVYHNNAYKSIELFVFSDI